MLLDDAADECVCLLAETARGSAERRARLQSVDTPHLSRSTHDTPFRCHRQAIVPQQQHSRN